MDATYTVLIDGQLIETYDNIDVAFAVGHLLAEIDEDLTVYVEETE